MSFDADMIKSFIRSDLGCDCPDEVFDLIKYEHNCKLWHDLIIDHVLVIGDRLLVYIFFVDETKGVKSNFKKILGYGVKWRDDYGLNRFRLVIVTEKIKTIERMVQPLFEKMTAGDGKVHLHILNRGKLKGDKYSFLELELSK